MKNNSLSRLCLLWMLPLAWLGSCLAPSEDAHYISLTLEDSVTTFQHVRVVLAAPAPGVDTLDVLWDGPLPDLGKLKKVRVNRYKGGNALVVVRGFNQGQLLYHRMIAYNSSTGIARIDSLAVRDSLPPVLTSRIPNDTLTLESWSQFPDSLVKCYDARDGLLKREIDTMARDTRLPTLYTSIVFCRDLSRNSNRSAGDTVMVWLKPKPRFVPVLTLAGRDSLDLPLGGSHAAGATCRDEEDGDLAVKSEGTVDAGTLGEYVLTYSCKDKDGNETVRKQAVRVSDTLDQDPPVVTLNGPAVLDHLLGTPYVDSGAICMDLRDGVRPIMASGNVDVNSPGEYEWEFKCRDVTGNTAVPTRKIRVSSFTVVPGRADAIVDTTAKGTTVNSGGTPVLTFGKMIPFPDPFATLLAFDLGGARKDSLKSARGVFQTYVSGPYTPALNAIQVVFVVHRIRSPWVEGTGNWYYNRGFYQNRGHTFLRNHAFREDIMAKSTDPIVRSGFTKEQRDIIRIPNMQEAGRDTVTLSYRFANFSNAHPGSVPEKRHLLPVEIDLTRYVKETPDGEDHGLVITTEGIPNNLWINWVTRELGDGTMGPVIKLFH